MAWSVNRSLLPLTPSLWFGMKTSNHTVTHGTAAFVVRDIGVWSAYDICLTNLLSLCLPSEGEEVMKSRVLVLQLLQNCFAVLPSPSPLEFKGLEESRGTEDGAVTSASATASPSTSTSSEPDSARAVWELYTHLCQSKGLVHLLDTQWYRCISSFSVTFRKMQCALGSQGKI